MQNPFSGQERLFEEERKVREVIGAPVPQYMLDYMRDHPAFRCEAMPSYILDYQRHHPAFNDTESRNGKIVYNIM